MHVVGRHRFAATLTVLVVIATVLSASVGPVNARAAQDTPLVPYDLAPAGSESEPRVFAHYFPPYPVSIDNKPAADDYYAVNYLDPDGEGGKHREYGGLLRDRPLPQEPRSASDWKKQNFIKEVNQAADAGIDGFFVDVLGVGGLNWDRVVDLTEAAAESGRDFVVAPQLDPTASAGNASTVTIAEQLAVLAKMPGAYKTPTGEFVLSAFKAEEKSVGWWSDIISQLENKYKISTSFRPVFLNATKMDEFSAISDAVGNWGVRNPGSTLAGPDYAAQARKLGLKWIQPISVQDTRPRTKVYWEAANLAQLRASWSRAIDDGADYVVLNTWNDYSETTSFAPSVGHDWAFLDVSGYYATRFKTGQYPALLRDALYLTHRKQPYGAKPQLNQQLQELRNGDRNPAQDTVEVMTLLTAPATVTITTGASSKDVEAPAGVNQYSVPLGLGEIEVTARRNGVIVASTTTGVEATDSPKVQDLQYIASGSIRQPADPPAVDVAPPSAPTGLAATVSGSDVSLTWKQSTDDIGVTGYRVERVEAGASDWTAIQVVAGLSFTDTGRPEGRWAYRVRALDAAGNASPASGQVVAALSDGSLPDAPESLIGTVIAYRVLLTWSQSSDGLASSYRVERSPTGTGDWTVIAEPTGTVFVSTSKRPPGPWYYRVAGVNALGEAGPYTPVTRVDIPDSTAPTAPTNPSAVVNGDQIALKWQESTDNVGVTAYRVERSPDGVADWSQLARTSTPSYTDRGKPGETWYYRISATDAAGNLGLETDPFGAAIPDTTPPTTPTGLAAVQTGNVASLTWTEATDVVGVAGYRVERSANGADGWQQIGFSAETSFDSDVVPGDVWFYRVAAVDAAGNKSPASPSVRIAVTDRVPPTAPTGVLATVDGNDVVLTWQPATDDVAVSRYRVERSANGINRWTQIAVTTDTNYTDADLPPGLRFYRVTAVDSSSNNGSPSVAVPATLVDTTPPTAPTSLSADLTESDVYLTWTQATDDTAVTGYRVERSANGSDGWETLGATTSTNYFDAGRPVGTWYYRVLATDASNLTSAPSKAASVVIDDLEPPTTPDALAAEAIGYDVALSWEAATDNVAVAGYRIQRSAVGSNKWTQIAITTDPAYTDLSRPVGSWLYRIAAFDGAGNSAAPAGPVEATVEDTSPPTAPTGLAADVSLNKVTLTWNASSDNSGAVSYLLERSPGGTKQWTTVGTTTATTVLDTGREPGLWSYRLTALDAAGNRSPSVATQARINDFLPPSAPGGLVATASGYAVSLTWQAATDNVGVVAYRVERSPDGKQDWVQLVRTPATSFTDTQRPAGTWYYRVTARDAANNISPATPVVSAEVGEVPGTPQLEVLGPVADSYVHQLKPTQNFGTLNQMFSLGPDPVLRSYLKFDLPQAPPGTTLSQAAIRLRTTSASGAGSKDTQLVSLSQGAWEEDTITFDDQPTVTSTVLGTFSGGVESDAFFDIELNAAALRDSLGSPTTVTMSSIDGSGDKLDFWSKDYSVSSYRPQLFLIFTPVSPAAAPTTTEAPTIQ